MKLTVNLISNIFIAIILALLPYMAVIKTVIKNPDTSFINSNMIFIVVLNTIVYILAVIGLEIVEYKVKEKGVKIHFSTFLFILLLLPIILKYILGMVLSFIPNLINYHITIVDDIILIVYTIIMIIMFFRYSIYAVYFLLPLLIYYIYSAF